MQKERAIWLKRDGNHSVVLVEAGGQWIEMIREPFDAPFSHIVESVGISNKISEAAHEQSTKDLQASGGLLDAP